MSKITGVNIKSAALAPGSSILSRLDPKTQQNLRDKPNTLRSVVRILSYAIVIIGGIAAEAALNLYDTQQALKPGISDFNQGMTFSSDALIAGIRLQYAQAATVGNGGTVAVADKNYSNLMYSRTNLVAGGVDMDAGGAGVQSTPVPSRTLPLELLGAKFKLFVGSDLKFQCDVADFFIENDRKDYQNGDLSDFISLQEQLVLIPANTEVRATITGASGVTVSNAVNHFFKWSLMVSHFEQTA